MSFDSKFAIVFFNFIQKVKYLILRASMHLRNEYPMWENTRKLRWKMIGAALGWSFGCNLFTFVLPAPPLVQLVEPKVIQLIQTLSCVRSIYSPSYFLTQIEFPILLKWGLGCNFITFVVCLLPLLHFWWGLFWFPPLQMVLPDKSDPTHPNSSQLATTFTRW